MMNTLTTCFSNYKRAQDKFVSVQEAWLFNRIAKYGFFRFRFAALSTLLSLSVHILEFLILSSLFSFDNFRALFLLRTIATVFHSTWWGMLEVLRAQVRILYADRDLQGIRKEILHWMLLAGSLAIIISVVAIGLYLVSPKISVVSKVFKLYFLVILIQIAIQLLVSTFHAGLYAVKRIPRPFLSIAITDVFAIIVVLCFPDTLQVYTLPVSLLLSSILSGWLSVRYTARAYHDANFFHWERPKAALFFQFIKSIPYTEFWQAGLASTVFSMDIIILNILIMSNASSNSTYKIITILYLLAPLVRSTASWTSLFYFDLKRSIDPLLLLFNQAFKKRLFIFAINIGLVSWLLSLVVVFWIHPTYPFFVSLLLLLLLVLISCVHYLQMEIFCDGGYVNVIISGLFTLTIFIYTISRNTPLPYMFCILFACFSISLCFFSASPLLFRRKTIRPLVALSRCEWLSKLSLINHPVIITKLHLTMPHAVKENLLLAKRIAVHIGESGSCCYEKNALAIYCFTETPLLLEWITCHGFGLINEISELRFTDIVDEWEIPEASPKSTLHTIDAVYSKCIKNGMIVLPGQYNPSLHSFSHGDIKDILRRSCSFIRGDNHMLQESHHSVEAYYKDGLIRAIFITPVNENSITERNKWWALLHKKNLEPTKN